MLKLLYLILNSNNYKLCPKWTKNPLYILKKSLSYIIIEDKVIIYILMKKCEKFSS